MRTRSNSHWFTNCLLAVCAILLIPQARAFPPAPSHTIFGIVRDQIGNPLGNGAQVILEASSGARLTTIVMAQVDSSINYKLEIPMDAGLTSDLYSPTALMPAAPFRIRVKVGQTTFLPMEMAGNLSNLGLPGGSTRIDLTLGVDADGNGLPDGWEKAVAAFLGRPWVSGEIRPGDIYPGSGMTYLEVYLAGTYAIDPEDGFSLKISNTPEGLPRLSFTAVKGRHYTIQAADTLGQWQAVSFRLLPGASDASPVESYYATSTKHIDLEPPVSETGPVRFYRLIVD